ncbi:cytochrome P460 family protein [Yoonia sediminilitoris]|uniref:Cytochrome P460 n=1 Tax=Yoonia sediminilitoris TaxID=1286148 RepID=A0A2T6K5D0_9RHOB|nr:cytochrome P460 family protein [Yoonia sediminilitoris]PUB09872.1 cytochrome P460 [Yoonia sediminilitoris]RCW89595.1 cytochrome P460 [Yoonia sediminilitoris]
MKFRAALTALALFPASTAFAQDCTAYTAEDPYDLTEAEIAAFYDCLKESMAEGYASQGDAVGNAYRDWTITQTAPGLAGVHGNRLLITYANEFAAEQYLQYAEDITMPVGSVLAKESITLSSKRQAARPGPLFIMTKLAEGEAPEADDWLYAGVQPNGKEMKIKQSFCHDCHVNYDYQDNLAYPLEEVRISQ